MLQYGLDDLLILNGEERPDIAFLKTREHQ
jgi:hypothetical protein